MKSLDLFEFKQVDSATNSYEIKVIFNKIHPQKIDGTQDYIYYKLQEIQAMIEHEFNEIEMDRAITEESLNEN